MNNTIKGLMFYLLISFFVISCSQDVDWKKYDGINFSISSPKDWERTKTANNDTFVFKTKKESSSDTFQENFNVIIQDLGTGMSLKDYSELTYNQVKQAIGEKSILDFKDASLSNQLAKEMSYVIPKNPSAQQYIDLKVWQKWIIKDNKAYILTYTAEKGKFDNYKSIAEKMFGFFNLK